MTIFGLKMMVKSGLDFLYKMSSRWCAIYFRTVMRCYKDNLLLLVTMDALIFDQRFAQKMKLLGMF